MQGFINKIIRIGRTTCPNQRIIPDNFHLSCWSTTFCTLVIIKLVFFSLCNRTTLITNHANVLFLMCHILDIRIHIMIHLVKTLFIIVICIIYNVRFSLHPADCRDIKLPTTFLSLIICCDNLFNKLVIRVNRFHEPLNGVHTVTSRENADHCVFP